MAHGSSATADITSPDSGGLTIHFPILLSTASPTPPTPALPAFDAVEFGELSNMIGKAGVMEMVGIFEAETGNRLRRLAAGGQTVGTLIREMHTLKGAAGTVASPRLAALGWMLEQAAHEAIMPTAEDLAAIANALEAWLEEVRAWSQLREQA
jgi:HPt (histidine-containing phosphotransfer) domain-containing protein